MPEVTTRNRRAATLLLTLLFMLILSAGGAQRWLTGMQQPVNPGAVQPQTVEIPPGASTAEVAEILFVGKLIKDPTFFRYYTRYRKLDSQLKPGEYELSASMTPDQILGKLTRGEVVVRRFTIPEGLTITQMADLLAAKELVNKEKFLKAAAESKLAAAYLPKEVGLAQPLEGYLFPDTYEYQRGITEEQILQMLFARFEQVLTTELRARAKEMKLSVHEVVTLASIIEKEAQVAAERPRIGGVYHNRLAIGMKLDADPTVRYAVNKPPQEELLYKDLDVESPYNSYRNAGLPPGPIAAPGEASIKAALYPDQHDLWYFVAKADGSGEHYFAGTLDEQDANIGKSRQNAAARKN